MVKKNYLGGKGESLWLMLKEYCVGVEGGSLIRDDGGKILRLAAC